MFLVLANRQPLLMVNFYFKRQQSEMVLPQAIISLFSQKLNRVKDIFLNTKRQYARFACTIYLGRHIKGTLVSNLNANFGHSLGRGNRQRLQFHQAGTIFAILLQTWNLEEQARKQGMLFAQLGRKYKGCFNTIPSLKATPKSMSPFKTDKQTNRQLKLKQGMW